MSNGTYIEHLGATNNAPFRAVVESLDCEHEANLRPHLKIPMLNADELGEKGEARFREICADAALICNQSDRDRAGWDFIVDFSFDPVGHGGSLEARRSPLSCHIQVKTLLEGNDRFQMRLSSAERLAKELKPTFIYVLKISPTLEFIDAYLIHLMDEPLGKILKALRRADVAGAPASNRRKISMSARSDGRRVAPTGNDLRSAIAAAIGGNLHAYADKKRLQLAELGFTASAVTLNVALHAGDMEELVDAFLGLRRNIRASNLRATTTRFGITKPLLNFGSAECVVNIQPLPLDKCTIAVRDDKLSAPSFFKGHVYGPGIPNLPPERLKLLFDTEFFALSLHPYRFTLTCKSPPSEQTLRAWVSYWRLMHTLSVGQGTIEIVWDTQPVSHSIDITSKGTGFTPEFCKAVLALCEQATAVLEIAGVLDEPKVTLTNLKHNADRIAVLDAMTRSNEGPASISVVTEYVDAWPLNYDATIVDFVTLGNITIGYYGLAHLTGVRSNDEIRWHAARDGFALKGVEAVHATRENYERFFERAKQSTGCSNLLATRPVEFGE